MMEPVLIFLVEFNFSSRFGVKIAQNKFHEYLLPEIFCPPKYLPNKVNLKQGVQGLQAFAFCVVTVNYKYTEPKFKRKRRG